MTVVYLLWATGIILQALFIAVEHAKKYVPAVILKGSASLVFCILGFITFTAAYANGFVGALPRLIFTGLIFGLVGDVLLNLRFVFEKIGQKIFLAGIAAFLTGHILYLVALIPLSDSLLISVIAGAIVAAVILALIFKAFDVKLAFKIFGVLYIGAVVIMTSIAIGNCFTSGFAPFQLVYAIGAVLFTASDLVLIINTFGTKTLFALRITNLSLYYVGQLLIATSLILL